MKQTQNKSLESLVQAMTLDQSFRFSTSLAKAHKRVLEVVIATLCKCLAEDKSPSLFGIKQCQGTSNHPQHLMKRVQLIRTRGLTAAPRPLKLILAAKTHLRSHLLCSLSSKFTLQACRACFVHFFIYILV